MNWVNPHEWPSSRVAAAAWQEERRHQVICTGNLREPSRIAAVEAAYGFGGETVYAAAVAFSFPELRELDRSQFSAPASFPYTPGLFYFREGPVLVEALKGLQCEPDVVLVSGHGIAHPRRCGIASHLGLDFNVPTIGCARRLLCGSHRPLDSAKGSSQWIKYQNVEVGLAYRSKDGVKPIYISPGHLCDLTVARDLVVRCLRGYRLPEPLRSAHLRANKHKRYIET